MWSRVAVWFCSDDGDLDRWAAVMVADCGHPHCEQHRCALDPWRGITPSTSAAVALVDEDTCPQCGARAETQAWGQEPLFWWRGSGGVEGRRMRVCMAGCGWQLVTAHTTQHPEDPPGL